MKLSICIATYNRARVIGQTIESIAPQLSDDCELVIADGASPDNTASVVRSYAESNPQIRYVQLPKKGGVDRDYCLCVEAARGEFCWLLSDDDLLTPDAVARVLAQLDSHIDLLIANASTHGPDFQETFQERRMPIREDRTFTPDRLADFAKLAGDYLTFIGGVVIRRSVWLARDPEPYIGTEFIHVGMIFQAPFSGSIRVLAEPVIRIRYGVAQWGSRGFEIWMFKWPGLIWSLELIPEASRAAITPAKPWTRITRLAIFKARGLYTSKEYQTFLRGQRLGGFPRTIMHLLAIFPDRLYIRIMRRVIPLVAPKDLMLQMEMDAALKRFEPAKQ
jgi:glycosyltransferase involved in cell wall biosynthesis